MLATTTNLNTSCALAAVFGFVLLAGSSGAQPPLPTSARPLDEKKILAEVMATRAQPELPSLDKMLISAIENNPDILVAKSKLHEAEAELNRTRLQIARQVITLRFSVQNLRVRVEVLQDGVRQQRITVGPLMEKLVELTALEADLQYILGGQLSPNK